MHKTDLRHVLGFASLLLLLLGPLSGCTGNKSSLEKRLQSDVRALAVAWKSDPVGCKAVRSDDSANAILNEVVGKKEVRVEDVEQLLGKAEFTHVRNGMRVVGYYYDGDCENGLIPDDGVYCVLEFYFNEDGLLDDGMAVCG